MVRSLYKSADLKKESSVTFDLVDGFKHMRCHFGTIFQSKFNAEVTSLYTSADLGKILCNF